MKKCKNCGAEFNGNFCPACGERVEEQAIDNTASVSLSQGGAAAAPSFFTGGAFANAFTSWLVAFVGLISLGFAFPAMFCWKCRWEAKHTFINGRRLAFDGTGSQLFGNFLVWMLLSLITFGIYFMTLGKMKLIAWKTKHTHFEGAEKTEENKSEFTGKWYQLFGVNWLSNFVTIITLSFGYYWAHCYRERWYCKHKVIDGVVLSFNGTAGQYFGKRILWTLLTIITLGIYGFWLKVKSLKWTVSHTSAENPDLIPCPPDCASEEAEAAEAEKKPANAYAVAGLVLGCLGVFACAPVMNMGGASIVMFIFNWLFELFSPVGLVLSIVGLLRAKELNGLRKKTAVAGIAVSAIVIASYLVENIVYLLRFTEFYPVV